MCLHVRDKVPTILQSLPADMTLEWSFARMSPVVRLSLCQAVSQSIGQCH